MLVPRAAAAHNVVACRHEMFFRSLSYRSERRKDKREWMPAVVRVAATPFLWLFVRPIRLEER
jgi:hypothetical protein